MVIVRSKLQNVKAQALERFAVRAKRAAGVRGDVDVLVTSSAQMRRLNRRFRGKNAATDVLSFPAGHDGTETLRNSSSPSSVRRDFFDHHAGDLAISAEIARRNARRLGHTTADELKILILHGLLHLAGYDHEKDAGEMARKEARLRRELELPASLVERASDHGKARTAKRSRRP